MKKNGFQKVLATMALFSLTLVLVLAGCQDEDTSGNNGGKPINTDPVVTSVNLASSATPGVVVEGEGGELNYLITVVGANVFPINLTASDVIFGAKSGEAVVPINGFTITGGSVTESNTAAAFKIDVNPGVTADVYELYISVRGIISNKLDIEIYRSNPIKDVFIENSDSAEVGTSLILRRENDSFSDAYFFQWQRKLSREADIYYVNIDGATDVEYVITRADIYHLLRVLVYHEDIIGFIPCGPVGPIDNPEDQPITGEVTVTGNAVIGDTLTANITGLNSGEEAIYHWERRLGTGDWTGIFGENEKTYVINENDGGHVVRAYVTSLYTRGERYSNATNIILPRLTGSVTISGNPYVTWTLEADISELNGAGTPEYEWQSGGTAVAGENGASYVVRAGDVGRTINVVVKREGYFGSVNGGPTAAAAAQPSIPGTVTIEGEAKFRERLDAVLSNTSGPGEFVYEWQRKGDSDADFNTISNAVHSFYHAKLDDIDYTIRVKVTRIGYLNEIVSSPTAKVENTVQKTVAEQLQALRDMEDKPNSIEITTGSTNETLEPQSLAGLSGVTITLSGLPGDSLTLGSSGAMFTIPAGVTLIIEDIELKGTTTNTNNRALIEVTGGTLTMKDGAKITGNTNTTITTNLGGGVRVAGGTFNMTGGEISGNSNRYGGGVAVNAAASNFNMSGGTISGNTASTAANNSGGQGGGVFVTANGAVFTMTGGTITNNTASYMGNGAGQGGGVFVQTQGRFVLRDGIISNNSATSASGTPQGGGIANSTNGRTLIHGGTITGNSAFRGTAAGQGGGVINTGAGTLSFTGGVISNNTAFQGGGLANLNQSAEISTVVIYGREAPEGLRNNVVGSGSGTSVYISAIIYFSHLNHETHALIADISQLSTVSTNCTVDVLNGVTQTFAITGLPDIYWGAARHPLNIANNTRAVYIEINYNNEIIDLGGWYVTANSPSFFLPVSPGGKMEISLEFIVASSGATLGAYTITIDYARGQNVIPYSSLISNLVDTITITGIPEKHHSDLVDLIFATATNYYWLYEDVEVKATLTFDMKEWMLTPALYEIHLGFNWISGGYEAEYGILTRLERGNNTIPFNEFIDLATLGRMARSIQPDQSGKRLAPSASWMTPQRNNAVIQQELQLQPRR